MLEALAVLRIWAAARFAPCELPTTTLEESIGSDLIFRFVYRTMLMCIVNEVSANGEQAND